MLRVIHLSTYDCVGGAAVAAFRLNESLNLLGVDSKMFVRDRTRTSLHVIRYDPRKNSLFVKFSLNYRKNKIQRRYANYKHIPKNLEMFSGPLSALEENSIFSDPGC